MMKLLSIDIFQTLVDITPNKYKLWKNFLGSSFDKELADKGWSLATKHVFRILQDMEQLNDFFKLEAVFEQVYLTVFNELGVKYPPNEASLGLKAIHKNPHVFHDSPAFLKDMKKKYIICLSSDADNDMLEGILDVFPCDALYTSENLKTYKIWKRNNFFSTIMRDFKLKPDEILHIGDASSDIIGANSAGIKVCWLNRNNKSWQYSGKPDITVNNFKQLADYL